MTFDLKEFRELAEADSLNGLDWPMPRVGDELREAADEIERLQAIVERLPKTADGMPVVPDVDKVFWPGDVVGSDLVLIDATIALDVGLGGYVLYRGYEVFDRNGHAVSVSDSYSTTEAAITAESEAV